MTRADRFPLVSTASPGLPRSTCEPGPERPSERDTGPERPPERETGPERPSEPKRGPERGPASVFRVRRRSPLVLGTVAAVVALGAAVGAGAVVKALDDEPKQSKPEVTLSFDARDDESGKDDLIGGSVDGKAAPTGAFALLDGGSTSLADLHGRPVVVNFFAAWCAPCVKEMPAFEQVHQELGDKVAFVGIDVRDSVSAARKLVDKTGVTYTIGRDPSGGIFESFDGVNMPSTFLVSADGKVVAVHAGAMTGDTLRSLVHDKLQ